MKKPFAVGLLVASLFWTQAVVAQDGVEGKHYARKAIAIESGRAVRVTGSNYSIGEGDGNRARVVLTVNGRTVGDKTNEGERVSVEYTIEGNGTFRILATCYNHKARAETCSITTEAEKVEKY